MAVTRTQAIEPWQYRGLIACLESADMPPADGFTLLRTIFAPHLGAAGQLPAGTAAAAPLPETAAVAATEQKGASRRNRRTSTAASNKASATAAAPRRARDGSKRDSVLNLIYEHGPMTRGDILEWMGVKGDKSGEMSVSNALTAITKGGQARREGGKYVIGNWSPAQANIKTVQQGALDQLQAAAA